MKFSMFVLVAFLGYGCAAKKIAIDNADTLISRQVLKRLPLKSEQKEVLKKDIQAFLKDEQKNVKSILPVIDQITLDSEITTKAQYAQLETFVLALSNNFTAMFSKHMVTLDESQQKEFFNRLEKENKRILKKDKGDRLDSAENYLEHFFGKINNDQLKIVASYGDYFQENAKVRVKRREALQKKFKEIYASNDENAVKEKLFHEAFMDYMNESTKSGKNLEMLNKLLPTLTDDQKKRFKTKASEITDLLQYFMQVEY